MTNPVAEPRRQPRLANRSTAGSMASERKNATRPMTMSTRSSWSAQRAAKSATTQAAAEREAAGNPRGQGPSVVSRGSGSGGPGLGRGPGRERLGRIDHDAGVPGTPGAESRVSRPTAERGSAEG